MDDKQNGITILPRLIRFRDAPRYLGMDRNRFNAEVRPYVTEIPIGSQGIAFDRLDLDAWVEQYKSRNVTGHFPTFFPRAPLARKT